MTLAAYQAELCNKLSDVDAQLDALRDKRYLLMTERARLVYMLRNAGSRASARAGQ